MFTEVMNDRLSMSFNIWWHGILPWLDRQPKPWGPVLSSCSPQDLQVCARHMGAPTLRPKAVQIASLNIRSPSDETAAGGAFSISAEILRCRLYSGPAGCRKCVGLLAGPKISVDLWPRGQVCSPARSSSI